MSIAPRGPRHRARSVFMETSEVVQELCNVLTSRLVAALTGVKDPGQARKWVRGELEPTQAAQQRLRFAHDVLHEIENAQGKKVAQAWAISVNPPAPVTTRHSGDPRGQVPGDSGCGQALDGRVRRFAWARHRSAELSS